MKKYILKVIIVFVACLAFLPSVGFANISNVPQSNIVIEPTDISKGQSTDVINERTENTKSFDLGNGHHRLEISMGAIHYKDNYGDKSEQWKDIDLTWVGNKITKAPYELTLDGDKVTIRDKKTGEISTIELLSIGGILIAPQIYQKSTGLANVSNIALDTDLEIVAENGRVKFSRILKTAKAPTDAEFRVTGNFVVKAGDMDGELPVESNLLSGILTETLKPDRLVKYPVRIDPTYQIGTSFSDGYVYPAAGYDKTAASLYFGTNATPVPISIWLNFPNVTIPTVVTIDTAIIQHTASANYAGVTCKAIIYGEAADSPTYPTTYADYWGRARTAHSSAWTVAAWTLDATYDSNDISPIIQEIVSRLGWASGNAIQLFEQDNGSNISAFRALYSYDGSTTKCAKLIITYTVLHPVTDGNLIGIGVILK